jgi:hypothetical protein
MKELTCGVNVAKIIQKLFAMDVLKNSNQSVLVGILGLYTGSRGQVDQILLDVMHQIDETRRINVISSPETWATFRAGMSRFNVEAISSSLESPFTVIELDTMRKNSVEFDVWEDNTVDASFEGAERLNASYDPHFWLPIIAYCFEKATHSSQVTLFMQNYSIGYALVCLSSMHETVRKMATSILIHWEELSQACLPRNQR